MSNADNRQWLRDRVAYHVFRLVRLEAMPSETRVPCPRCHAATPRSIELCCGTGDMSVVEAKQFHRDELAVLEAPMQAPVGMEAKP